MKYGIGLLIGILGWSVGVNAQTAPFEVILEQVEVPSLGGLQSFAFGQSEGKWLIIGGRLDGLHRRQPWATFDEAGHNTSLFVVDPVNLQQWSAPLSSLPVAMQEQLQSTNMEFFQKGDYLYLLGGYGFSATANDHVTFANITAVDVPATINAIINATPFQTYFRQWDDPEFQVTGGHLEMIGDTYYLVGGQKFMGKYNPMNNPTFTQEYTNAIRKFRLTDDGTTLTIDHLPTISDSVNLHRRDYNVTAQIMPDGAEGITAFSGVFQPTVDLPYLNCVNIDSTGYQVNNNFSQYYNHYHCANLPIYAQGANEMHTVFFGGIAQYYDSVGILVQDNNVPFVRTIARVTRTSDGTMSEYKMPVEMPALLGAGSEFIPDESQPRFANRVFKLDDFVNDTTLVGYIYGGISSTDANIFWVNDGTQSSASSMIFKVLIVKSATSGLDMLNMHSNSPLKMLVYPNPSDGIFEVSYTLQTACDVHLMLYSEEGKKVEDVILKNQGAGQHQWSAKSRKMMKGGTYYLTLETPAERAVQKIIVEP